jgi:molecular chaperone Hsp33
MAAGNEIRYFAAYTKDSVEKAREIHNTSPVCSAAMGRLLTGGALMGAMCKNDTDVLTLKVEGNGPIHSITVTADAKSNVKSIIYNNNVDLPLKPNKHLDVASAVGLGVLTVIRDEGLKEPYVGTTALMTSEIGDDLTYYFAESEQIPTSVGLGVLVDKDYSIKHAGGFIIQLLPFASEETISKLEESIAKVQSVTEYFDKGMTVEEMMRSIIGEEVFGCDLTIEEKRSVQYKCNCSRERVTKALISIGRKELQSIIDDGEPITMHCDFCNSDYKFEVDEIKQLMTEI